MARVTIAAERRALSLTGAPKPEPLIRNFYIIAYVTNGKEEFLVPELFLQRLVSAFSVLAVSSDSNDLAGVQNAVGIERHFYRTHDVDRFAMLRD